MRRFLSFLIGMCLLPLSVAAQEDDRGFLTRTIENALSGAGREVRIDGFAGALSSVASFDRMIIEDAQGGWLTLEDVKLEWSRLALLRGRLEVDRLSAGSLQLDRLPVTEETEELPSAEASGFSFQLPDLPVSIDIQVFEVAEIDLGAPILGVPARLSVNAKALLNDDGLQLDVKAERIDEVTGAFTIAANVERSGTDITLDLALAEEPGGIAAKLLNLPGEPSVDLKVAGTGPLEEFKTEIALATDGVMRVEGAVELLADTDQQEGSSPDRRILANIGGDITALIATDYHDFFGPNVALTVDTVLRSDGAIDVSSFEVAARAVALKGSVRLNSDKWPTFIDVDGRIAQGGTPVVLPGSNSGVTIRSVDLDVNYDAADNDALSGSFDISELEHEAVQIERTQLALDGILNGDVASIGQLLADLTLDATGVVLADATASRALGGSITGGANINYIEGQAIRISGLSVEGEDYGLEGMVIIRGLENGFPTRLQLAVDASDLSRFAELVGQPMAGAAKLSVGGTVTPLAGTFDLSISGTTQDLTLEIPEADAVLAGLTTLSLDAARDETGTFVRDLVLKNNALNVAAEAALRSAGSNVSARVGLADVALVLPQYEGAVTVQADAQQTSAGWRVQAKANAPYQTTLSVEGLATGPDADVQFDLATPDVNPFADGIEGPLAASGRVRQSPKGYLVYINADGPHDVRVAVEGLATGPDADVTFDLAVPEVQRFVASVTGALEAQGRVKQSPDGFVVDLDANGPYQSKVSLAGLATGPKANLSYSASMPDISVFVPDIGGPLQLEGEVARQGARWNVNSDVQGPSGTTALVKGTAAEDGSDVDVTIAGQVPLGLSAPFLAPRNLQGQADFDLAVRGAPALTSVSGRIRTSGARFTAPNLRLGLTDLNTTIDLSGGSARIDAAAAVSSGGQLSVGGSINLSNLAANLAIALRNAVLKDPKLYAATMNGDISVDGPLTGGARIAGTINLSEVNVTVPSTGLTSIGAIPDIRHIGGGGQIVATRQRAGVVPEEETDTGAGGGGAAYPLSVIVNAPSRIFVRGRGLNAELGGSLRITGTTSNIISAGNFDLVRGRLDIIGKRFDLDEGSVQFQGSVTPYIRFVSTTEIPDGTASIIVEGLATEPDIRFTSNPEAPEDEVLSLIIFGRYTSQLSAFQALQLVNGLAELSGRKGVGVLGNLQSGIGLDELDVTTTESGETKVTAGKYITDNIYTDVTTSAESGTDISLNIDLTESVTGKATVGSEGQSSFGLFFERDY